MRSSSAVAVRRAALITLPAGLLTATVAFSGPASAATITDPGTAAARYLSQQLAAGGNRLLYDSFMGGPRYDNAGGTADAIMGLAASGTSRTQAAKSTAWFAKNLTAYTGSGSTISAGATAKALLLAVVEGENPRTFGGVDLIDQLQDRLAATGRFEDKLDAGDKNAQDYSSSISQSLALLGLQRAGQTISPTAVSYLLKQQCSNGGFDFTLDDASCTSDPDATGFVVQALVAVGGQRNAVSKAVTYLAGQQKASGAVGDVGVANSTGLAAMAFTAAGDTARATMARSYLKTLQYDCGFPVALRGGLAANAQNLADKKQVGSKAAPDQSDDTATAQGIVGLVGSSYVTVSASGSTSATPADACTATPTGTATSTATPTSSVTGPPVITDGPQDSSGGGLLVGAVIAGGALATGAAGLRRVSRRAGRH